MMQFVNTRILLFSLLQNAKGSCWKEAKYSMRNWLQREEK